MNAERPHSVRDRSTGWCDICESEQELNESTGRLIFHRIKKKGVWLKCEGTGEFPSRVLHTPELMVAKRARVTAPRGARFDADRQPRRPTRQPRQPGEVKVRQVRPKAVDPKVWLEAVKESSRLGGVPINISLPKLNLVVRP